jgi:rhodanese-related sulfurtransferase
MASKPNYSLLAVLAVLFAITLAFVVNQPGKRLLAETDPAELANDIVNKNAFIHPDELAKMIIEKQAVNIVDLRSDEDFTAYSIKNSENMPVKYFLMEGKEDLSEDVKTILVSNGDTQASQVWLILEMMGYKNVFVLQGGANYWVETQVFPKPPKQASPDTEVFKYAKRVANASFLHGGAVAAPAETKKAKKPVFKVKKKKKKKQAARSGCGTP